MSDNNNNTVPIIVAIIGLTGVIATALISNWDKIFKNNTPAQVEIVKADSKDTNSTHGNVKRDVDTLVKIENPPADSDKNFTAVTDKSFIDAFEIVFGNKKENFQYMKTTPLPGDSYGTNVIINSPYIVDTKILKRVTHWKFLFNLTGPSEREKGAIEKYDGLINNYLIQLYGSVKRSKSPSGKGSNPDLQNISYFREDYEIDLERSIGNDGKFHDTITVTNLM